MVPQMTIADFSETQIILLLSKGQTGLLEGFVKCYKVKQRVTNFHPSRHFLELLIQGGRTGSL